MREHPIEQQKRNPKSFKADGSPKRRWTAAERAARGHKPRTREVSETGTPIPGVVTSRHGLPGKTCVAMTLAVAETAVFPRIDATMSGLMAVRTVVTTAVTGIVATTAGGPMTASSAPTNRVDRATTLIVIGSVTTAADRHGTVTIGARTVVDSGATAMTTGIAVMAAVTSTAGTPETGVRTVTAGAMIAVMTAGQTARITAATTGPVTTTTTTIWIGRPLS